MDYHRPSSYAHCFYQISQRGTSMPPVKRTQGDCLISTWGPSIPGRQDNRQMDSSFATIDNNSIMIRGGWGCPCWNFHHDYFAWLPLAAQCSSLTSMHTPIFCLITPFSLSSWICRTKSANMISTCLQVCPMTAWFRLNNQLIPSHTHNLHNAYHNSFLRLFSHEL